MLEECLLDGVEVFTLLHVVDQGRSHLDELNVDVLEGFGGPRARGRATGPRIYGKVSRSSV